MSTILTASGQYFPFDTPHTHVFRVADIAHALSHLCRFTGHTRSFYSVAQHSVHVSELVPAAFRLEALMHDASEAYLGDVSSPLKRMLPDYKAIERRVEEAIAAQFGLPLVQSPEIKVADLRMLVTEKRDLLPHIQYDTVCWPSHKPAEFKVQPWGSKFAKEKFVDKFLEYSYERANA